MALAQHHYLYDLLGTGTHNLSDIPNNTWTHGRIASDAVIYFFIKLLTACTILIITGPPIHSVEGGVLFYSLASLVCNTPQRACRRLNRAGKAMMPCRLQSNYISTVTLHGGPVVLHPVRATPSLIIQHMVCVLVTLTCPAKTAEPTEMLFGELTQVGPRNPALNGGQDPPRE